MNNDNTNEEELREEFSETGDYLSGEQEEYVSIFRDTRRIFFGKNISPHFRASIYEATNNIPGTIIIYRKKGLIVRQSIDSNNNPISLRFPWIFVPNQTMKIHNSECHYYSSLLEHFLTYYPYHQVIFRSKREAENYLLYFVFPQHTDEKYVADFESRWCKFISGGTHYRPLNLATYQEVPVMLTYSILSMIPYQFRRRIIFTETTCHVWHDLPPVEVEQSAIYFSGMNSYHIEFVKRTILELEQAFCVYRNSTTCFDSEGKRISYYTSNDERDTSEDYYEKTEKEILLDEVDNSLIDSLELFTQKDYKDMTNMERRSCINLGGNLFSILHLSIYRHQGNKINPVTRQDLPDYLPLIQLNKGYFYNIHKDTSEIILDGDDVSLITPIDKVRLMSRRDYLSTEIPFCITIFLSAGGIASTINYARDFADLYLNPKLFCLFQFAKRRFRSTSRNNAINEVNRYISLTVIPNI